MDTIYLAGGCFWGMEHLFRQLPGVLAVTPGYANGDGEEHANYQDVCTGLTGFRETVRVDYDPEAVPRVTCSSPFSAVVQTRQLPNPQGMDIGTQYQTGVYWTKRTQRP